MKQDGYNFPAWQRTQEKVPSCFIILRGWTLKYMVFKVIIFLEVFMGGAEIEKTPVFFVYSFLLLYYGRYSFG
jgi:hypothetical protein